jgi:hypothetical protein
MAIKTFGGFPFEEETMISFINERDPINSLMISSGIVSPAPSEVASQLTFKNNVVRIPFYVPFDGDALNYDGVQDNDPVSLSGSSMAGMAYRRMKAWTEQEFTHEITGSNDLANMARNLGDYRAKQNQKTLLSILTGLEGVGDFSTHVNDIAKADSGTPVSSNKLGADNAVVAMQGALGDHMNEFQLWFMHSAVFTDLVRQGLATDTVITTGAITKDPSIKMFLGKPVIVDDTMTSSLNATSGLNEYHTYLCGTGLFMTCPARIDTPLAVDQDYKTKGGVLDLYFKWGRLMHPYGFDFAYGNVSKESPTNAEFANSANWTMKYDTKNIPLVVFVSNVS